MKWLLQNVRRRAAFALKNPRYVTSALMREPTDRLHTYEHMFWEFETAYRGLRRGRLLFADDAIWNDAFHDFARRVQEPNARIIRGVGFLRKTAA